jgi:hypothetical protein
MLATFRPALHGPLDTFLVEGLHARMLAIIAHQVHENTKAQVPLKGSCAST